MEAAAAVHPAHASQLQAEFEGWLAAQAPTYMAANNVSVWERTRRLASALTVAAVAVAVVLGVRAA